MRTQHLLRALLVVPMLAACGAAQTTGTTEGGGGGSGGSEGGETPQGPSSSTPAPATLDEQLTLGARLYEEECAGCHGSDGAGRKSAPAIMGPNALPRIPPAGALRRTIPFNTAKEVLDWTAEAMPSNNPASLDAVQYAAIVAHQLSAIGLDLKGVPLSSETAGDIRLR